MKLQNCYNGNKIESIAKFKNQKDTFLACYYPSKIGRYFVALNFLHLTVYCTFRTDLQTTLFA